MPHASLSLAIVCNAFPAGEQARALGIWAGISAIALGIGPLAGGVLVELDWRLIFWINLPIAALGIAIMALAAPESTDPGAGRRVDLPGLATLGVGLTTIVLALVQARVWGGGVTALLALLGASCLYAFWRIEHRVREPDRRLLPLSQRAVFRR
jgi:MFS family permease